VYAVRGPKGSINIVKQQEFEEGVAEEQLSEMFEPETEYYQLSNGRMIQVDYRPALNRTPLPGSMNISYVDPKVTPHQSITTKIHSWQDAPVDIKQAIVKWASSPQAKQTTEGSMAGAEHHATGPEFTGYWRGKDAGTPGRKMVGASESVDVPTGLAECEPGTEITTRSGDHSGRVERVEDGKVYFRSENGKLYRTSERNVVKSVEEDGTVPTAMGSTNPSAMTPADRQKAAAAQTAATTVASKMKPLMPTGTDTALLKQTLANPQADPSKVSPQVKNKVDMPLANQVLKAVQTGAQKDPATMNQLIRSIDTLNKKA
jgi:hypothetical protein